MDFIDKWKIFLRSCIHQLKWSLKAVASVQVFFNARVDIKSTGISFINKDYRSIGVSVV